jgi:putative peptidoglycan lipid II flippase
MSSKPPSDDRRTDIGRNTLVVGAANLVSRFTGLFREIAFAAAFGAGVSADAFNAAFRVGNMFRELFAEGALANAFVPLFADVAEREGETSGWGLANALLGVLMAAVGAATLLTLVFAEPLVLVFATGFAEDPDKLDLATALTRVLSPFVATISVASVFMGMLNVRGRFFMPAVVPVLFNGAVIAACVGSSVFGEATGLNPIYGVAIAALIGGCAQAAVQYPALRGQGFRLRPTFGRHPQLKRLVAFLVPALIAISVVQINLLIETNLASRMGHGPVSWLLYAFRVAHLPFSIISGGVAVAALAGLSVLASQDRHDEFRQALLSAVNLNSFLILPASVGLFFLADPIVALLFERGAFTPADTAATAGMLRMYAIALFGIGQQRVLVPVFYALMDPKTPMWIALGIVAFKLPVALLLIHTLGMGVNGIPGSHAVLATVEVVLLLAFLQRKVGGLWVGLFLPHIKMIMACGVLGVALSALPEVSGLAILPISGVGALVYLVTAHVLGLQESRQVAARLFKRRPRGLPPTVDPETRGILADLHMNPQSPVVLQDGIACVQTADHRITFRAQDGLLFGTQLASPASQDLSPLPVQAVMRVGGGPPTLAGLVLGEVAIRADGDQVVAGMATGPVIPVTG